MIIVFQSVMTQFRKLFLDKFRITKCEKASLLQRSQTLQSVTDYYYKV